MRIAQIAPLDESVPPRHYGGTERVVSYLTEELVAQGHDVALFASGDSVNFGEALSVLRFGAAFGYCHPRPTPRPSVDAGQGA